MRFLKLLKIKGNGKIIFSVVSIGEGMVVKKQLTV